MTVSYSRSEVVLSTDPKRLARGPYYCGDKFPGAVMPEEHTFEGSSCIYCPASRPGPTPARKEVIRDLAPHRVEPRTQREWHDVFRGDE